MPTTPAAQPADPDHGWQLARQLCQVIAADGRAVARHGVGSIRAEHPEYAAIDLADHEEMVHWQLLAILDGLTSRSLPTAAQAGHARLLGARRAEQGIPVEAVLNSFHIGYRELWNIMLDRALSDHPGQAGRLLELVNVLWAWVAAMTSAAAEGYAETVRSREEARSQLGHQFLAALYGGQASAQSCALLARALGFDPHGSFQAICCATASYPGQATDLLARRLREAAGTSVAVVRRSWLVIILQDVPARLVAELASGGEGVTAGVGSVRPGLTGAADSIADAEWAMALAERQGGVVDYGSDWLPATLLPHLDRLRPLLDPRTAPAQPYLRDAVRAFAAHGFSVTASAQALHIHPNTMKYRLDRWQQLTGWNPRTLDGLVRSTLSISFSDGTTQRPDEQGR